MALFAVGLSNIYRFPHMVYIHGGMTFLIPYVIFLVFIATPLLYLEVLVGQFVNSGMINVWKKLVPFLRGMS
jgi:NSS family neurotransmitter:Na+ symporter